MNKIEKVVNKTAYALMNLIIDAMFVIFKTALFFAVIIGIGAFVGWIVS